jgi:hypothetical protein
MDHVGNSSRAARRPPWWKLYAFVTAALMLVALVEMKVPAGAGHTGMQMIAGLIPFGTMALWVRANKVGLALEGRRRGEWRRAALQATSLAWPVSDADEADHRDRPAAGSQSEHRGASTGGRGISHLHLREAGDEGRALALRG